MDQILIDGDTFTLTLNEDGTGKYECERNKRGMKVTIRFNRDQKKHEKAMRVIGNFLTSQFN